MDEKSSYQQLFEFYKRRLVNECGEHGRFRFNVIEYLCGFPGIDPVEMAVALKKDGFEIVFDDSSISHKENVKKHYAVERRYAEVAKVESVDGVIADAGEKHDGTDSFYYEIHVIDDDLKQLGHSVYFSCDHKLDYDTAIQLAIRNNLIDADDVEFVDCLRRVPLEEYQKATNGFEVSLDHKLAAAVERSGDAGGDSAGKTKQEMTNI